MPALLSFERRAGESRVTASWRHSLSHAPSKNWARKAYLLGLSCGTGILASLRRPDEQTRSSSSSSEQQRHRLHLFSTPVSLPSAGPEKRRRLTVPVAMVAGLYHLTPPLSSLVYLLHLSTPCVSDACPQGRSLVGRLCAAAVGAARLDAQQPPSPRPSKRGGHCRCFCPPSLPLTPRI